jgi:hypothetical protein
MIRGVLLALALVGCTRDNPGLELDTDAGGGEDLAVPDGGGGGDGGCAASVASDPRNCGSCGHDCTKLVHVQAALVQCSAGVCNVSNACLPGWDHCTANPDDGCETDLSSPSHCGGCAIKCNASDPLCIPWGPGHTCAASCPGATPTNCSGTCTNLTTDPKNCKTCGNQCPAPANGTATCTAAVCGHTCNVGYVPCGDSCIAVGTCCTNADCTLPLTCPVVGQPCACPSGQKWCASSGSYIASGSCCTAGDCSTTVANASPSCSLGVCGYTCNGGYRACNSGCIPSGQCCSSGDCPSVTNGTPVCSGGNCSFTCNATFMKCGSLCIGAGQCCMNTDCSTTVANATPLCNAGTCTFQCDATFHRCGGACIPLSQCCVNTDCSTTVANAHGVCNTGVCSYACNTNFKSCGAGCIPTTPGSCCMTSDCTTTVANATPLCASNQCTFQCNTNFNRCGSGCIPSTSCCVNTDCTTAPANGSPFCNAGTCDFVCNPGYQRSGSSCVACASHSNGLGQNYTDCSPLGTPGKAATYSSTMANEAANAYANVNGGSPVDSSMLCVAGTTEAGVEIDNTGDPFNPTCAIWIYSGPFAGYVSEGPTCQCPIAGAKTWN